jgi:hypothetical protein
VHKDVHIPSPPRIHITGDRDINLSNSRSSVNITDSPRLDLRQSKQSIDLNHT